MVFRAISLILCDYGQNPLVFILTFVFPILMYLASRDPPENEPPKAAPSIPFLGNALHYKKDPDEFLAKQAKLLGGIFSINLAGLQTTILSSKQTMKQLALTPESVLSSNAAVSDFGFRYTLGDKNVFAGTDVHKKIIKQKYSSQADLEDTAQQYWRHLTEAIKTEVKCDHGQEVIITDFFVVVRRVILRTIAYEMIGSEVVDEYNTSSARADEEEADFISDFMLFQDQVEDCTARAAVCPAWLASMLFLKDCERKRLVLTARLSGAIKRALEKGESADLGRWLRAMQGMRMASDSSAHLYTVDEIADFAVGLLFAAHKNPSIAAAQAVLFVLEYDQHQGAGPMVMAEVCAEAKAVERAALAMARSSPGMESVSLLETLNKCTGIERVVVETLRVTAHSIGAVRKVMAEEGWSVSVDNKLDQSQPAKQYVLPCGSYVGVSHIIPHRDQLRWGIDCAIFNPRRENLLQQSKNDFEFTTFSHGVHKCPGSRVAMLVVRLFAVAFLSHFAVKTVGGEDLPSPSFERATLAQREGKCRLSCRRMN